MLILTLFSFANAANAQAGHPCSAQGTPSTAQADVIQDVMGNADYRMKHYLWHSIRNSWATMTEAEQSYTLDTLGEEWEVERPPARDNDSGEDFFFMHRMMRKAVNDALVEDGLCPIQAWRVLPNPKSPSFPMAENPPVTPIILTDTFINFPTPLLQSDPTFELMRQWEAQYQDDTYLERVSLGQFGFDLEWTIHLFLHGRWANVPEELRPELDIWGQPYDESDLEGWSQFNAIDYNYLGDPYAAHINPTFWKFHGWIDDRIDDWLALRGFDTIAKDCGDDPTCYTWKGTWMGGPVEGIE